MKLWIANIAPGTNDEELRAFLARYGVEAVAEIQQVPGDGTRPAAILEIAATPETILRITQRLNGIYWQGRSLAVHAMMR
jgi:hypothetical protein